MDLQIKDPPLIRLCIHCWTICREWQEEKRKDLEEWEDCLFFIGNSALIVGAIVAAEVNSDLRLWRLNSHPPLGVNLIAKLFMSFL